MLYMSNSQRTPKHNKYTAGKVCPKCNKSKLEKASCAKCGSKGHEHHIFCPTCKTTNF